MFETRSEAWEAAGLSVDINKREVQSARRQAILLVPLLVAIVVGYDRIKADKWHVLKKTAIGNSTFETLLTVVAVVAVIACGWALARAIGKTAGPTFLRRMDPATAGTFGFMARLITIVIAVLVALHLAGVDTRTLAVGGAFTAVVFGLAAQQTLGNAIAGMVLLSARPFRVGERVRLQAGAIGGAHDGTVSSLGLLYTTLTSGTDQIMIPNNQVLAAVVVPLKDPDSVDVKVRLSSGVRPSQVQAILDQEISTPTRSRPSVLLEELDGEDVVVRVQATPLASNEGAKLADQIIVALASVTGAHEANGGVPGNGSSDSAPRRTDSAARHDDPAVWRDDSAARRDDSAAGHDDPAVRRDDPDAAWRDDPAAWGDDPVVRREDRAVGREDRTVRRADRTVRAGDRTDPQKDRPPYRGDRSAPRDDGSPPRDDGSPPRDDGGSVGPGLGGTPRRAGDGRGYR